jgi:hypothetical protein
MELRFESGYALHTLVMRVVTCVKHSLFGLCISTANKITTYF